MEKRRVTRELVQECQDDRVKTLPSTFVRIDKALQKFIMHWGSEDEDDVNVDSL